MTKLKIAQIRRPSNKDAIEKLEHYLKLAREGEVQEVFFVIGRFDGDVITDWTGTENVFERIGHLHHAAIQYSNSLRQTDVP